MIKLFIVIGAIVIGAVAFLIAIIVGLIVIFRTSKKKVDEDTTGIGSFDEIITAIGGLDNILSSKNEHQRVTVRLVDFKQINLDLLKNLNISAFILKDEIKILFKKNAEDFVIYLKKQRGETR